MFGRRFIFFFIIPLRLGGAPAIQQKLPSLVSPPTLELKPLPDNLKYVHLGDKETLPIIISSSLNELQESKLIKVLREHREAFGWTLADIKGLSTTLCTHKIAL